jgi:hypothetical protein
MTALFSRFIPAPRFPEIFENFPDFCSLATLAIHDFTPVRQAMHTRLPIARRWWVLRETHNIWQKKTAYYTICSYAVY